MGTAAARVRVWIVYLDMPSKAVARLSPMLSSDERERVSAFRSEVHARRYAVARVALRCVLAERLGAAAGTLRFSYSPFGRPELARSQNEAGLRFSVSRSHELALIAVGTGVPIGVDVEHLRQIEDLDELVQLFFSSEEISALSALPPADRLERFFTCWTRKEAYLKATGLGLSSPLDGFAVTVAPGEEPRILHIGGDRDAGRSWHLRELFPAAGYRATLAVKSRAAHVAMTGWVPPEP